MSPIVKPGSINNAGRVAGTAGGRATVWNGTTTIDLGPGVARAINDPGQVAGTSGSHATLWNATTATDLGTLGGTNSIAYGVNNTGQVAGYSYVAGDAAIHATL